MPERRKRRLPLILAACLIAGAGLFLVLRRTQALPQGPQPVVWDKESCAHCRMAVSDRRFAAQLQLRDGRVLEFDDPGCLFTYLDQEKPAVHAIYFRSVKGDGWLPSDRALFETVAETPMDYGLGAVGEGTPGAMSLAEARARVAQVNARRGAR